MRNLFRMSVFCLAALASYQASAVEYLVRFTQVGPEQERFVARHGGTLTLVSEAGALFKWETTSDQALHVATWEPSVAYIQPNYTIQLPINPSIEANREAIRLAMGVIDPSFFGSPQPDNPAIKAPPTQRSGPDPMLAKAWGLTQIGAPSFWSRSNAGREIVVAVTDTGVDYNHEDLIANMWRNPGEIPGDGIDNDGNGYVDDVVGWDFAANDALPYDLTVDFFSLMFGGGNPGHGTHVAGVIGATRNNSLGIAGVAPNVRIMALRFITEKGQGTTEAAIKSIDYAVNNGAHIINASWGGEKGSEDDSALVEAIQRAERAGVIFVAAAGNGRADMAAGTSAGFDNDTDPRPMVPASLPIANIVSVAAIDVNEQLGTFSNWGKRTVHVGAPGVKVLSTVPGGYQDTVIDLGFLGIQATWDGTSMAAPHVAGALAAVWSDNPQWRYEQVVDTVLRSTKPIPALTGKVASDGRLDLSVVR